MNYNTINKIDELRLMLESVNSINELINKQLTEYTDAKLICNTRNLNWNIRTQIGILNEMINKINDK